MIPVFDIMDTTLRDGSYACGFSFSKTLTARLAGALDAAGCRYIEVGHGVGLNAANMGKGEALHTDVEYITSAVGAARNAKIGVFCIPGIAGVEHVEAAADAGVSFVRVGTNANEVETSRKIVEKCKSLGLTVFANYMKSYVISPAQFCEQVKKSVGYGADAVYVVDSAGGMFPDDIARYFGVVREAFGDSVKMGFHGHDNLSLAVSNTLHAVSLGAAFVDASLQGLGRGAGNAATEILVACLLKKYGRCEIDLKKVLEAGWRHVAPLNPSRKTSPLDVVSGLSDFHSSFMHDIHKTAAKYEVDPLALIMEYASVDKVGMDVGMLSSMARRIARTKKCAGVGYDFNGYHGHEQS